MSWKGRHFGSIFQRIEVIKTFALSRLYYVASILPLPQRFALAIERTIGKFVWAFSGKILRVSMDDMKLPALKGGGQLTCMQKMSKSLLFTQVLRLLKSDDEKSIAHLGFWLGELLGDFLPGIEKGFHCQDPGQYYAQLADIVVEIKLIGCVTGENWRSVLNKNVYSTLCSNLLPPKIERDNNVSFKHSWINLKHDFLLSSAREILFLLLHDKLLVRERLFRISQAADPYCTSCLDHYGAIVCDVDHYFCSCPRVVRIWGRLKSLVIALLQIDSQRTDDSSVLRLNIPVNRCPGVIWMMGAYVSTIWNIKDDSTVCDDEFFGFLKFKFKVDKLGTLDQLEMLSRLI